MGMGLRLAHSLLWFGISIYTRVTDRPKERVLPLTLISGYLVNKEENPKEYLFCNPAQ